MIYLALNLTILLTLFVLLNLLMRRTPWRSIGLTLAILTTLTIIFDNLIIAIGTVAYDQDKILGLMVGLAPIEDFAYTVAAVLLVPAIWIHLGRKEQAKGQK